MCSFDVPYRTYPMKEYIVKDKSNSLLDWHCSKSSKFVQSKGWQPAEGQMYSLQSITYWLWYPKIRNNDIPVLTRLSNISKIYCRYVKKSRSTMLLPLPTMPLPQLTTPLPPPTTPLPLPTMPLPQHTMPLHLPTMEFCHPCQDKYNAMFIIRLSLFPSWYLFPIEMQKHIISCIKLLNFRLYYI